MGVGGIKIPGCRGVQRNAVCSTTANPGCHLLRRGATPANAKWVPADFPYSRAGNGGKRENPVFAFWATGRQLGASGGPLGASGGPLGARGGPLGARGGPLGARISHFFLEILTGSLES